MYKYKLVHFLLNPIFELNTNCAYNDITRNLSNIDIEKHIIANARVNIGTKLKRYSDKK